MSHTVSIVSLHLLSFKSLFQDNERYTSSIWKKIKQNCLQKIPCVEKLKKSPEWGVKVTTLSIVTTLFIPIILVGTDMVTDVEVMWSMANPLFFEVPSCLQETYKETSMQGLVRILCLVGSFIIFAVSLVNMFKRPGPIPFLMRSVRTTASMGSRELESMNNPVSLGKKLLWQN